MPLATEAPTGLVPEAVRLPLERARALRPSFDGDAGVLRDIAKRLDGIPLAIELAARAGPRPHYPYQRGGVSRPLTCRSPSGVFSPTARTRSSNKPRPDT